MRKRLFWLGLCFLPFLGWAGFDVRFTPQGPVNQKTAERPPASTPIDGLVSVPVADLRSEPSAVSPQAASQKPYPIDPKQETQLLYGETVLILEEKGLWVRVEAPDQAEYLLSGHWQGYPGWVLRESVMPHPSDFYPSAVVIARYARVKQSKKIASAFMELPMGARVGVIYTEKGWVRVQGPKGEMGWMRAQDVLLDREAPKKISEIRVAVLAAARQFIGEPYYWGGRCGHQKRGDTPSGVDCSGLVNVAYRAVCLNAPRDAHEQFMSAHPLKNGTDLQPGDLVFLAKKSTPDRMTHVMIYEKPDTLIEAVHQENKVRRVSFKKKLDVSQKDLHSGSVAGDVIVHFATYFE